MKTTIAKSLFVILGLLVFFSCDKESNDSAPEIPPFETMVVDFGDLVSTNKSAETDQTGLSKINWVYSAATVGIWNILIGVTFAVPVSSFKAAFGNLPGHTGDKTWEWSYNVDGFTSGYTARLVGEVLDDNIKWEMYVTKTGTSSFDDFLWFEGTSALDGMSGQWILYHSPGFPDEVVQIDWKREGDEVGEVKYTYVRESDNFGNAEDFYGSYLVYGLQDQVFDAYVTIHAYSENEGAFTDTQIEWSRSDYSGRVKAEHFFNDTDWHCWDSDGNDVACN